MPSAGYPRGPARSPPCKVVLLGEGRVGKTSLVLRFCKDSFSEAQPPTIQASYLDKQMTIGDKRLSLAIWDTAGQERFHALGPIYYRDADAALLVYDITDADSFKKVKSWVKELRKMARRRRRARPPAAPARPPARHRRRPTPLTAPSLSPPVGEDIVISIAGNKLDLERQRVVTKQEAADYAASVGAQYAETSAKNGRGIEDAFGGMARRLLASPKVATRMNGSVSGGMIVDDAVESRRGGCC